MNATRSEPIATPIVGTDLYPTMLALAGASLPAGRTIDGMDLLPLLRGTGALADRPILFHQPHKWGPAGPGIEPFSAIRLGDWKLIWFHDDRGGARRLELYEVAQDCEENDERSAENPEKRAELVRALRAALESAGAQMPTDRASGVEVSLGSPDR